MFVALLALVASLLCSCPAPAAAGAGEEPLSARLEARVHRCLRDNSPGLVIPVGSFAEMAKVEVCATEGMTALSVGTPAPLVKRSINGCVNGNSFPDAVAASVGRFKDCITRALT